jgi:hypothetical protein
MSVADTHAARGSLPHPLSRCNAAEW